MYYIFVQTVTFYFTAVICESTVAGLRFYEEDGWSKTACVIEFFLQLWKIQNVKSPYKGKSMVRVGNLKVYSQFCNTSFIVHILVLLSRKVPIL